MSTNRTLFQKKVHSLQTIAEGVYVLSIVRDFTFKSGQVIAIDIVSDGKPRLYSIASGENDEFLDILFDEKRNGKLTPYLSKLKAGDDIYVSEAFGTFTTTTDKAYWIAAGTGIAPFVSMARSGLGANKILVHGARFDSNFYFSDLIEKIMPDSFVRCCSQQEDSKYFKGRLTSWLSNQNDLPADYHYYLCGSAEMVVQVRDILIEKKIPFQNIISETYF